MGNTKFTGRSSSYIFEEAGGKRDQLEQAILNELQVKQYPLKATIQTLKGGKGLAGCILRHPTADFAEQNGRNAKLIGHRPLPL